MKYCHKMLHYFPHLLNYNLFKVYINYSYVKNIVIVLLTTYQLYVIQKNVHNQQIYVMNTKKIQIVLYYYNRLLDNNK